MYEDGATYAVVEGNQVQLARPQRIAIVTSSPERIDKMQIFHRIPLLHQIPTILMLARPGQQSISSERIVESTLLQS